MLVNTILSSLHNTIFPASRTSLPSASSLLTVNSVSPVTRTTAVESNSSEHPVDEVTSKVISYTPGLGNVTVGFSLSSTGTTDP